MAQADHYVYLVQQRLYEESIDQKGRLSVLGCYNSIRVANAAAKTEIRRLHEDGNPNSAQGRYDNYDGLLFDTTVFMGEPDTDRVDVFVEKILCASRCDGIINGDDYIPLEDEVEEVEEDDEMEEIEILEDDTPPATPHLSLSASKNSLVGLTFAFTGSLPKLSREEAEMLVYRCGGSVVAQPTKETNYVVLGANPAQTRLKKIQELGIKTISEKDLCHMATGIAKSIERDGMQDEEVDDLAVISSASTPQRSSVAATVGTANLDGASPNTVRKAMNGKNIVSYDDGTDDYAVVSSPSTPRQSSIAATVGTAELDLASSSTAQNAMSALIPTSPQGNINRKRGREEGIESETFEEDQSPPKRQKDLHSLETEIIADSSEYTQLSMKAQEEQQLSEQEIVVKSIEEEKPAVTEQEGQQLPEQEFLVGSIQAGQPSTMEQEDQQLSEKEMVAESDGEGKLPLKGLGERLVPETEITAEIAGEGQPSPKAQEELLVPEKQVATADAITEVTR
ncbi:hypothetical protein B0J14DRAFT_636618 [Halenospora varia]|nr:hypothetical protein B0J14DRAFT_636618 [Halenospora varia]